MWKNAHCTRPPIQHLHCIYQQGKTFYFLFLRVKFRNPSMLFNETLVEFLHPDIVFTKILCLTIFFKKVSQSRKWAFFQLQYRFLNPLMFQGTLFDLCIRLTSRLLNSIFEILNVILRKKKNNFIEFRPF